MPTLLERSHNARIHLQRLSHRVNRHRHPVGFKHIQHSPDPHARAILVVAFGVEGPLAGSAGAFTLFPEEGLGLGVAVEDAAFGALERGLVN